MSQSIFAITSFEDCNKIIRIQYTNKLFFNGVAWFYTFIGYQTKKLTVHFYINNLQKYTLNIF